MAHFFGRVLQHPKGALVDGHVISPTGGTGDRKMDGALSQCRKYGACAVKVEAKLGAAERELEKGLQSWRDVAHRLTQLSMTDGLRPDDSDQEQMVMACLRTTKKLRRFLLPEVHPAFCDGMLAPRSKLDDVEGAAKLFGSAKSEKDYYEGRVKEVKDPDSEKGQRRRQKMDTAVTTFNDAETRLVASFAAARSAATSTFNGRTEVRTKVQDTAQVFLDAADLARRRERERGDEEDSDDDEDFEHFDDVRSRSASATMDEIAKHARKGFLRFRVAAKHGRLGTSSPTPPTALASTEMTPVLAEACETLSALEDFLSHAKPVANAHAAAASLASFVEALADANDLLHASATAITNAEKDDLGSFGASTTSKVVNDDLNISDGPAWRPSAAHLRDTVKRAVRRLTDDFTSAMKAARRTIDARDELVLEAHHYLRKECDLRRQSPSSSTPTSSLDEKIARNLEKKQAALSVLADHDKTIATALSHLDTTRIIVVTAVANDLFACLLTFWSSLGAPR